MERYGSVFGGVALLAPSAGVDVAGGGATGATVLRGASIAGTRTSDKAGDGLGGAATGAGAGVAAGTGVGRVGSAGDVRAIGTCVPASLDGVVAGALDTGGFVGDTGTLGRTDGNGGSDISFVTALSRGAMAACGGATGR